MSLITFILDLLFPREPSEEYILSLTPSDLAPYLSLQHTEKTLSLFTYKTTLIKKVIWMLKYKGERRVATLLSRICADVLMEELADESMLSGKRSIVLIPIPLSNKRERERGYNQTALLAHEIAPLISATVDEKLLTRTRHTPPQTTLAREERLKNVIGAFAVKGICDPHTLYILLDDVITTGSTIGEAEKTLRSAGARTLYSVALAQ